MDRNHVWMNYEENLSPTFENMPLQAQPFGPQPYLRRNGLFVNTPTFTTPKCYRVSSFPPETFSSNCINTNVRFQPHVPVRTSFPVTDHRGFETYHEGSCGPEIERRFLCCPQKMHSNAGNVNCNQINNHSQSKVNNKRQKLSNYDVLRNFSAVNISSNCEINYVADSVDKNRQENYAVNTIDKNQQVNPTATSAVSNESNKEALVKIKDGNCYNKLENAQSYANGKDCSYEDVIKTNIDNVEAHFKYENETENINFVANSIDLNPAYQNDPFLNNVTNALEDGTNFIFTDATASAGTSGLQSMNGLDHSNSQITRISIPENFHSNAQNVQQETSKYTDLESSFFKPIFEGKDENGEDFVVLLADLEMQKLVSGETNADTFACNESLNTEINQDAALNMAEDNTVIDPSSSEFHFGGQQIKQEYNDHTQDIFFSHINDHATEEIAAAPKTPETRKRKRGKKNNASTDRNQETAVKPTAVGNEVKNSYASEPSTSTGMSTNSAQNFQYPPDSNKPLREIQREYFRRIIERVKMENKYVITDERFWNMYRSMLNSIGNSVMSAMYNMLPALIRNYEASSGIAKNKYHCNKIE